MEHSPTAATTTDEADGRSIRRMQEGKIDFDPGVLVPPDDDAGGIGVQEEHG